MRLSSPWHCAAAALVCAGASLPAYAAPISAFGAVAGYNVVALGSSVIPGTIVVTSDTGRLAAATLILNAASIGPLHNDTFGNPNGIDFVSPSGYSGQTVNIQSPGSAYAPGASAGRFNFNGGGSLVQSGPGPVDFAAARTSLVSLSSSIFAFSPTGSVALNGDQLTLTGTSPSLNVFAVTASQLASATGQLNINAPAGSTVLVNVLSDLGAASAIGLPKLFYNGVQTSGDDPSTSNILFNFNQDAAVVALNGQFSASVLAPFATITGDSQLDGQFIAAAFADTGEVHNVEFTGNLSAGMPADPGVSSTPEPSSLLLLGSGLSVLASCHRLRRRS